MMTRIRVTLSHEARMEEKAVSEVYSPENFYIRPWRFWPASEALGPNVRIFRTSLTDVRAKKKRMPH